MVEGEAGVIPECRGIGGVGGLIQAMKRCADEPASLRLALRLRRRQPVANGHQLVHLGDDAALLGEGRKREGEAFQFALRNVL